ncbi:MAG TPA: sugar MFS transporter [Cytophagaceae bacterium]|jgi:FHS family L-fucose permease-like MFS transporter|nr:sugar MFS transporter [Cytophagaceae bacterium]
MASKGGGTLENNTQESKGYLLPLIIIGALFFIFGFVTWVNGTLIPYLQIACELDPFQSTLVTFAFYIAYFIMALPSSWVLGKIGYKKSMSLGLFIMAIGAAIFIPAALSRSYFTFLVGLFCQGVGLALLQTAANPYATVLGPIESAAKRISIMGVCNKVAGAIGTVTLAKIILSGSDELKKKLLVLTDVSEKNILLDQMASKVIAPYIFISIAFAVVAVLLNFSPLPEINIEKEDPKENASSGKSIFSYTYLVLGVIALFLYVGVEVIAGDFIIVYGTDFWNIPIGEAQNFIMYILIMMVVAYLIGATIIPKYLSQENALKICAVLGMILVVGITFSSGLTSIYMVIGLGFANALVWPAIWPLALKDLGSHIKTGSALLIMAIVGGATLPLLYGSLSEVVGRQQAYWLMFPCYLFILFYAMKGHKMGLQKKTNNLNGGTGNSLNQPVSPSKNGKVLESVLK